MCTHKCCSCVELISIFTLWQHLEKLKYIKLNHSQKLSKTPNFETIPNLTRLELEGCTNLVNIHPTIFTAKKLTFLSLKDCINLTNFPTKINIEALQVLILSGVQSWRRFHNFQATQIYYWNSIWMAPPYFAYLPQ